MFTPTKTTPDGLVAWYTDSRSAASARHGEHQLAQKFTTTTWPFCAARSNVAPSSSSPLTAGAALRSLTGIRPLCARVSADGLEQPAALNVAAARPNRAARRVSAISGSCAFAGAQVGGRLGVVDADEPIAVEPERRQAGQPALPPPRVVPEP